MANFTLRGSHGNVVVNADTGAFIFTDCEEYKIYQGARADMPEYKKWMADNGFNLDVEDDILLVGWYMADEKHEPAEAEFREFLLEEALWRAGA